MKLKRDATALKERLEERNPGVEYEVRKDPDTTSRRTGPWYVARIRPNTRKKT